MSIYVVFKLMGTCQVQNPLHARSETKELAGQIVSFPRRRWSSSGGNYNTSKILRWHHSFSDLPIQSVLVRACWGSNLFCPGLWATADSFDCSASRKTGRSLYLHGSTSDLVFSRFCVRFKGPTAVVLLKLADLTILSCVGVFLGVIVRRGTTSEKNLLLLVITSKLLEMSYELLIWLQPRSQIHILFFFSPLADQQFLNLAAHYRMHNQ